MSTKWMSNVYINIYVAIAPPSTTTENDKWEEWKEIEYLVVREFNTHCSLLHHVVSTVCWLRIVAEAMEWYGSNIFEFILILFNSLLNHWCGICNLHVHIYNMLFKRNKCFCLCYYIKRNYMKRAQMQP